MSEGLLLWGQEGDYSAFDDRLAITALTAARYGIIRPATFSVQEGLNVAIAAGWMAVLPCGDGTNAVASAQQPGAIALNPGGAAARTDTIWVDIWTDAGRWGVAVLRPDELAGHDGIALATVAVPANATAATQMTITPAPVSFSAGALGPAGPPGATGPPGPQGEQGPVGGGITVRGTLANTGLLPSSGNTLGDAYLIGGALYVWTGSAWTNAGNIQGPAGVAGPTGPPGPAGNTGSTGPQGIPGTAGAPGAMGPAGQTGPQGPAGPPGPPANALTVRGTVQTSAPATTNTAATWLQIGAASVTFTENSRVVVMARADWSKTFNAGFLILSVFVTGPGVSEARYDIAFATPGAAVTAAFSGLLMLTASPGQWTFALRMYTSTIGLTVPAGALTQAWAAPL